MKILFFSRLFYPHIGGVEAHVLEIGKRLVQKGNTITILTEKFRKDLKDNELYEGINIARVAVGQNDWFKKFRIWQWLWQHSKLIEETDIIHCHDIFFWYLPFRFLYPKKPAYTTFHGYETIFPPSRKAILIRKLSEKLSWGTICVGDYIRKWYRTKPNYVTYGGVKIPPMPRIHTNNTSKKIKIIFVGRLEEDSGIDMYLKTLDILRKKHVDFVFEACGDGKFRRKIEERGKVHGFIEDLPAKLATADFVFASSYLSIFEAIAAKKLIFAVYENSLKEDYLLMSPFAKYIIISKNPKEIVQKLLYFKEHGDEQEALVDKGYDWIKSQTWDRVVDLYEQLWRHSKL